MPAPMLRLVAVGGPIEGQSFDLEHDVSTLGRDNSNDLVVKDATVSRHHCRVTRTATGYLLEDLGSTSGVYINNQRLAGPRALREGDLLLVGQTALLVQVVAPPRLQVDERTEPVLPVLKNRLHVFLSSTSVDLLDYRKAVLGAIHSLGGYTDDMAYWPADQQDGATLSLERVRQADVVILLVAHRYGYIPSNEPYSVTELEYRAARAADIPVLAFFLDPTVPWPPDFIEWPAKEKLEAFKKLIDTEVTRKTFKSPDELARLVTASLVNFEGRAARKKETRRFKGTLAAVSPLVVLETQPDTLVQIGLAEDGLPLLLEVHRADNLRQSLSTIQLTVPDLRRQFPDTLLSDLQQRLDEQKQFFPTTLQDGSTQLLYISRANLSRLFHATFPQILDQTRVLSRSDQQRLSSAPPPQTMPEHLGDLQSVGGLNRFLGISLADGRVYSVGRRDNGWVEWHPFVFEALAAHFADARYEILAAGELEPITGKLSGYGKALLNFALDRATPDGRLEAGVQLQFVVTRQAVGQLVLKVAQTLQEQHNGDGQIHGDLKPSNVLLAESGPVLIDSFNLEPGQRSPGWSPYWSAPEQILRAPVAFTTDVYALGRMIADLLSGYLVGEVRKFKTPPLQSGLDEFDIFYNPSVYVQPRLEIFANAEGRKAWLGLATQCLRFDAGQRLGLPAFLEQLAALLESHPLQGDLRIAFNASQVAAVILPDGREAMARLLRDELPTPAIPEAGGTSPTQIRSDSEAIYTSSRDAFHQTNVALRD